MAPILKVGSILKQGVHMYYLEAEQISDQFEGMISAKKQQRGYETDLTVASVYEITGGGAVDFGGSEEQAAGRNALDPQKESPEDKYGWWNLSEGSYVVAFNEKPVLVDSQIGFIQPHERLVRAGAAHPSYYFRNADEHLETVIVVGRGGVHIKENARISKCLVLQLEGDR